MRLGAAMALGMALLAISVGCGSDSTLTTNVAQTAAPEPQSAAPESQGGTVAKQYPAPPEMSIDTAKTYQAVFTTNRGEMTVKLFADEVPITVNNFVFLAREGYYNDVVFHRIIKGFMVQGGDPTGTGRGDPGYRFKDEPVSRDYVRGTLAMANSGPNTNGSQFFLVHELASLPKNYTIFGLITEGLDTLDGIANTPVGTSASGEASQPTERIFIESIEIVEARS